MKRLPITSPESVRGCRSFPRLKRTGFVLGLTILLTYAALSFSAWASESLVGQEAPDFVVEHAFNLDGSRSLRSLRGHPVLLYFSMGGCPMCKRWAPVIADIADEHGPKGLTVLQLSSDSVAEQYMEYQGNVSKNWIIAEAERSTIQAYAIGKKARFEVPRMLVIDGAGQVTFDESPNLWPFWAWSFNNRLHQALDKALLNAAPTLPSWVRPGSSIGDAASFLAVEKNRPPAARPYGPVEFARFSKGVDTDKPLTEEARATLRLFYWLNRPTSEWSEDGVVELGDAPPDWPGCEAVRLQATDVLGDHFLYVPTKGPAEGTKWFFEEFSFRVRRGDPSVTMRDRNIRTMRIACERMKKIQHLPDLAETIIQQTLTPALQSECDPRQQRSLIDAIYTLRFNLPYKEVVHQAIKGIAYVELGTNKEYPYLTLARKNYPSSNARQHYKAFREDQVKPNLAIVALLKEIEALGESRAPTLEKLQSVFAQVKERSETRIPDAIIAQYLFIEYLRRNLRVYELTPATREWAASTAATLFLETTTDDWRYLHDLLATLEDAGSEAVGHLDPEIVQKMRTRLTTDPLLVGYGRIEADIVLQMFQTSTSPSTSWSQRLYPRCREKSCRIR